MPSDDVQRALIEQQLLHQSGIHEVHLVTLTPDVSGKISQSGDAADSPFNDRSQSGDAADSPFIYHCIGTGKADYGRHGIVNLLALQKRYLQLLYRLMPDVVHIHGSYHYINSRIALWSHKRGFPVVFSPYGGMNPDYIDAEYGKRTWKILSYQRDMVRGVSCVIVSDPKECDYIRQQRWNDRVEYIAAPEDPASLAAYSSRVSAIYEKVLDSDKGLHISERIREASGALLHLSLADDTERQPLCPEDILNLRSLTPTDWRDLFLFASEQGVLPMVKDVLIKIQFGTLPIDISEVEHFEPRHTKDTSPLPDDHLLSGNRIVGYRMRKHLSRSDANIQHVCYMLQNIRYHQHHHSLTLRHLCDLYSVFRHDDMDEELLATTLRQLHLYPYARRVCQVLKEVAYLDDGYMPVPALDDSSTSKIRTDLMKY